MNKPEGGKLRVNYVLGSPVPPKSGYGKYALTVLDELTHLKGLGVRDIRAHFPLNFPFRNMLLDFSTTPVKTLLHSRGAITHASSQGLAFLGLLGVRPFVVTAYDAIPFALKEERKSPAKSGLLAMMRQGLRGADAIITISHFSKRELAKHAGLDERRIHIAYPGVDHAVFKPLATAKPDLRKVLYVGSEQPRKNVGVLLEAFAKARKKLPGLKLLKVGSPQWRGGREAFLAKARALGVADAITFVEGPTEAELAAIYRSCGVLVFPSTYEGFGLPPLEAMACGLPVVCSNAASLPEVVGSAAISLKPNDVDGFAKGIVSVLSKPAVRKRLKAKGFAQAKKFSWRKAALDTLKVYESLAPKN
jgi:glycosyltransferase involved in cell wall biosynthesis